MHLFIIPGNPPALYFYKLWAEEIQQAHKGCSVHISPYPALLTTRDSHAYLNDVAASHGEALSAFSKASKNKVLVIGHSLGAWMALRLLEKQGPIIENCILLYPFLRRPSFKGRAILRCMRHLYQVPFILSCRGILERLSKDLRYVTNEELRVSLTLARHEHTVIAKDKEPLKIPEYLQKKLHMIYCDQDKWCPEESIIQIKQSISHEKLDTTHGFITSMDERKIVLKALLDLLKNSYIN